MVGGDVSVHGLGFYGLTLVERKRCFVSRVVSPLLAPVGCFYKRGALVISLLWGLNLGP